MGLIYGSNVQLLFVFVGYFLFQNSNRQPQLYNNGKYLATVLEAPQNKENSYKSLLQIESFCSDKTFSKTKEKVLVYFAKEKNAQQLVPGEKIVFDETPQIIKNNGNPFEFDYKKYMERRKIFRQIYLNPENWRKTTLQNTKSILVRSEQTRNKLLKTFEKQELGENEREILSALTLGYKRELDPEIKQVFSAAGAMHVLAVSGLHVGIIYGILVFFLGFLNRKKAGKIIFTITSISILWAFAFITGLSPSVLRASVMFSFVILAKCINRQTNIYNTLAASAFILLLINPNNLFEVGFQLSYSAVLGIVFLQPKIAGLFTVSNKILRYFWILITVSIAAQITTFPFIVFYFNQFPSYFWISNLFVIPAAIILIPLAVAILVFSGVPVISVFISQIANFILSSLYFLLKWIENLPFSVLNVSIQKTVFLLLIVLILTFFLFLKTKKMAYIKTGMSLILLWLILSSFIKIETINRKEIIVYNNPQNQIVQLISGKTNYVISNQEIESESFAESQINQTCVSLHLNQPVFVERDSFFRNENIYSKNGIVFFEGKIIFLNKIMEDIPENFNPDFLVNPLENKETNRSFKKTVIIITRKNYYKSYNKNTSVYLVENQGAFRKNW